MKIALVTGATGFLGKHLTKRLLNDGWEIHISNTKTANLDNYSNLHMYNDIKFTHIFHLAAHTKAGDWCKYHKGEQWISNQTLNTNMLRYWQEHQPQAKIIIFGTSCSYGPSDYPMTENEYMITEPDVDLYTYAMTKRMLYVGCKSLAEQYNLKYIHYIPSTLYGEEFDSNDTHFIFDIIKKIINSKNNNTTAELWGDGYQKRELVYIDDAINIIMNTLHLENETINIGSGNDYTIREYVDIVCKILDYSPNKVTYNINKFVGVRRKILDISKLLSKLPKNFKFSSVNFGIKNTINYYLNKHTNIF